jgi:hypothetical protein
VLHACCAAERSLITLRERVDGSEPMRSNGKHTNKQSIDERMAHMRSCRRKPPPGKIIVRAPYRPTRKRRELTITRARSALRHSTSMLRAIDGRAPQMIRLRNLIALHVADLGGDDNITEAERRLVRRAAMLTLLLEMQDAKFAANPEAMNKASEFDAYLKATGALRRLLQAVGLQRRAKDVTPDLGTYLRAKEAAR